MGSSEVDDAPKVNLCWGWAKLLIFISLQVLEVLSDTSNNEVSFHLFYCRKKKNNNSTSTS